MDRTSDARPHLFGGGGAATRMLDSRGRRAAGKARTPAAHTVDRLTVHALSCALQPELDQLAAVDALVDIAAGNRSAIMRALRRIDQPGRPRTSAGQRAALLLRVALTDAPRNRGGASPQAAGAASCG